jgi:hypothetical protein
VTGRLELLDEGSRLLIRLGGPGTAIFFSKTNNRKAQKKEYEDTCTSIDDMCAHTINVCSYSYICVLILV